MVSAQSGSVMWSSVGVTTLGDLGGGSTIARAINSNGLIVGSSDDGSGYKAFQELAGGPFVRVPNPGTRESTATDVNDAGAIVGYYAGDDGNEHGFLVDGAGSHPIVDGANSVQPMSINSNAIVVGSTIDASGASMGFLWSNGNISHLAALGGPESGANDVNDAGIAVGFAAIASGDRHAARYFNAQVSDLGTLGGSGSIAQGINNSGDIVGSAQVSDGTWRAFVVPAGGTLQDLNARLPVGSAWVLQSASAIATRGSIVGSGQYKGQTHAFVLRLR